MKTIKMLVLGGTLLALSSFAQPTVTIQPTNLVVAPGGNGGFTAVVTGTGPFTYQWLFKGTNLPARLISTFAGGGVGDGGAATNAAVASPLGLAADRFGNVFIADNGDYRIRCLATNGIITTVAGMGTFGFSGDGGLATSAMLSGEQGVTVDAAGKVFIPDYYNSRIRCVDTNGIITTVAGTGSKAYSGDGGPATKAGVPYPVDVAVDGCGNLFVVDAYNNRIRKVATNGVITLFAGNGSGTYAGDGGPATNASLYQPEAVAVDAAGNVLIADQNNFRIRRVDTNGIITTVAGTGTYGHTGDGGPATNAEIKSVASVGLDGANNLYIPDGGDLRRVDTNGIITTVAGTGTNGYTGDGGPATNALISCGYVAADLVGNVYFSDGGDKVVRKVDLTGTISTVAGNGSATYAGNGCAAVNAELYYPVAVALDPAGDVFITDQSNVRVRKVDTNGIITTIAGIGLNGYTGDGGPGVNARLYEPMGVAADAAGDAFIADEWNYRVRMVVPSDIITTLAGGGMGNPANGAVATNVDLSGPKGMVVDNAGNVVFTDYESVYSVGTNGLMHIVAGTGYGGFLGDGGPATAAEFNSPFGLAVDLSGDLFIADTGNQRVRKVDTNGIITTVAGNGTNGFAGDGGAATNARLYNPSGVAVDTAGTLYIADELNNRIRAVRAGGAISTVAGNGSNSYSGDGGGATNAALSEPNGVAVDGAGNLFIADTDNHRIRKVTPFASLPTLWLNNVTTNNAGNYQVIVTGADGSMTSVVATLTVSLGPPTFAGWLLNSDRSLTLNLTCPAGSAGRLWAATNLVPPISWQPVSTNPSGGNWQYTESNTTALPSRFYRLSSP